MGSRKRARLRPILKKGRDEDGIVLTDICGDAETAVSASVSRPPPMNEELLRQEFARIEAEQQMLKQQQQRCQHHLQATQRYFPTADRAATSPLKKRPIHLQPEDITPEAIIPEITNANRFLKNGIQLRISSCMPPQLMVLYQELNDNVQQQALNDEETREAQHLLQEAKQRLDVAAQRALNITHAQNNLQSKILEAELQLDTDFARHYRRLLQFRQQFGHCNVTAVVAAAVSSGGGGGGADKTEYGDLLAWAKKMRRVKQMRASKTNTQYYQGPQWHFYLHALDRLGFVWDATADKWQTQFDKMLSFQHKNGHCAVPKNYGPDKSLGAWVHRQRYHYKLYHEGKPTQLTRERIELLNSVGFSWSGNISVLGTINNNNNNNNNYDTKALPQATQPRKGKTRRTSEQEWEHMFQQLVNFRRQYGHVKVNAFNDKERNNQLRDWVAWQRREYKLWQQGEPSHVTSEHVRRLSEIGFDWIVVKKSQRQQD